MSAPVSTEKLDNKLPLAATKIILPNASITMTNSKGDRVFLPQVTRVANEACGREAFTNTKKCTEEIQ
jgi:hypothetical protein